MILATGHGNVTRIVSRSFIEYLNILMRILQRANSKVSDLDAGNCTKNALKWFCQQKSVIPCLFATIHTDQKLIA